MAKSRYSDSSRISHRLAKLLVLAPALMREVLARHACLAADVAASASLRPSIHQ